jgi:hypothetical protein
VAYLLDSDVFIQAKNLHYGFDICPAFWDWLDVQHQTGKVVSIQKVGDELAAGGDDLSDWAAKRPALFLKPDAPVVEGLQQVSAYVSGGQYLPTAVSTFLQGADYYLVSHALAHGHVVVTHERVDNAIKRIKIPNVCIGMGIQCVNPFEMLRTERARFVLPS